MMRDTLDGVFRALLDEAYDWGAGLLKWGGDALLLMFDGPGHAWRASRAAWEMQGTIDRVGRLQVSGGFDHAADVRRHRDRSLPLLHDRQRPPGAAHRGARR